MVLTVSTLTGVIVGLICVVVLIQDTRRAIRICERERRRTESLLRQHGRLLVPVRVQAEAKGTDIEDLLILCGAEGWSEPGGSTKEGDE